MDENCPKLLDLIPKEKQKMGMEDLRYGCSSSDDKKLELRLGLPGDINSSVTENEKSFFSLGCFSSKNNNGGVIGCGQEQNHNPWSSISQQNNPPFLQNHHKYQTCPKGPKQHQGLPVMVKESSQPCSTRISELQTAEEKAFSPPSVNTAVLNSSQKRPAPPVVGWPPIRSFRKNLASSSGKGVSEPQSEIPSKPENQKSTKENNTHKGQFVKINMDGVPIGRKVDLSAYTNYSSLSSSVDKLFRGLLAAQRDCCPGAIDNKEEEQKPITDVLDGSGEYTLVYEDNEGDRMLVGDVPWHMFVATVKRLRVLKSCDLPTFSQVMVKKAR